MKRFSALCLGLILLLAASLYPSSIGKPGGGYSTVEDEGSPLPQRAIINMIGSGVNCVDAAPTTECDFSGAGMGGYDQIQEEGSNLTQRSTLNFTGAGITCADASMKTNCDVPGGGGGSTRGVFSAAPTCNGAASGTTYFATDAGLIGQCDGAAWQWQFGEFLAFPTSISVSSIWFNQSSASVSNTSDGAAVILAGTSSPANNIQARLQTIPATPYTYVVCGSSFQKSQVGSGGSVGALWTDGTNASTSKLISAAIFQQQAGSPVLAWVKFTNATTFNSNYTSNNFQIPPIGPFCIGLQDDGTNRKVAWSINGRWYAGGTSAVGNTDYLTPTHVGFYVDSSGSGIPTFYVFSEHVYPTTLF